MLPRIWLSAVRVDASPLARAILVVCSSMANIAMTRQLKIVYTCAMQGILTGMI